MSFRQLLIRFKIKMSFSTGKMEACLLGHWTSVHFRFDRIALECWAASYPVFGWESHHLSRLLQRRIGFRLWLLGYWSKYGRNCARNHFRLQSTFSKRNVLQLVQKFNIANLMPILRFCRSSSSLASSLASSTTMALCSGWSRKLAGYCRFRLGRLPPNQWTLLETFFSAKWFLNFFLPF